MMAVSTMARTAPPISPLNHGAERVSTLLGQADRHLCEVHCFSEAASGLWPGARRSLGW
jgi:hypothetical protein